MLFLQPLHFPKWFSAKQQYLQRHCCNNLQKLRSTAPISHYHSSLLSSHRYTELQSLVMVIQQRNLHLLFPLNMARVFFFFSYKTLLNSQHVSITKIPRILPKSHSITLKTFLKDVLSHLHHIKISSQCKHFSYYCAILDLEGKFIKESLKYGYLFKKCTFMDITFSH